MIYAVLIAIFSIFVVNGTVWYDVTESDITAKSQLGVNSVYSTDTNGNLQIDATIINYGCGQGDQSYIFAFISDNIDGNDFSHWGRIRYTMTFSGASSCWSLLGNTYYGDWPSNLQYTGLVEFNINRVHSIRNPDIIIQNNLLYGSWNGQTEGCDNEDTNFWHGRYGSGAKGSITVEQTRDFKRSFHGGIGSGHSCSSNAKVIYSNIQVGY